MSAILIRSIEKYGFQRFEIVGMTDRLDILVDDGPFIEVRCHIVRGCPDHLHAARMRLVIGLGPFETRQEGVVDVDTAPREVGCLLV